ncbi:MAG: phospholipase D-like domain-containing protein [Methanobacteriaceae archaeon]|jgi:phosphatidylserine/phosphatidylglycerophosphate/cardiolipin synthase-like enzyme
MKVSEEILEILEKIRSYRKNKEVFETLKSENEVYKKQNEEYKNTLTELQSDLVDRNRLIEQIKKLKSENRKLKLDNKRAGDRFDFIVTTPNSTGTVYAEIRKNLAKAEKEVLICSPWITYLVDEFKEINNQIDMKIITNFREEDVKSGITDIDKIRVLKKQGADIRYNNDLHAKMILIDSEIAIISSANLTRRGLSVNYEAGVIIKDQNHVKMALEFFKGVWEESEALEDGSLNVSG